MRFDFTKIAYSYLDQLPPRTADVIKRRFGLTIKNKGKKETLESIGKSYNLTRERVRQIEYEGLARIKKIVEREKDNQIFDFFNKTLLSFGGIKSENELLTILSLSNKKTNKEEISGEIIKSYIFFLLTIDYNLQRFPENKHFNSFWVVHKDLVKLLKEVVQKTVSFLKKENTPFQIDELFCHLRKSLPKYYFSISEKGKKARKTFDKIIFQSCLEISKEIEQGIDNEYGLKEWPLIRPKGVKEKAYLVLKKQNKPLHFREIASLINELPFSSSKTVHPATVHNELIKNENFVLVGRGLYALKEWGYQAGVVKDIVLNILKEAKKPLSKEEIVQKVLEQRFVKKNTIFLNLNDKNYFLRGEDGKYRIKEG